ncbi:hypothetical protein Esti_004253 [Eimeria stiedai]
MQDIGRAAAAAPAARFSTQPAEHQASSACLHRACMHSCVCTYVCVQRCLGLARSRGFSTWSGLGAFVEPQFQAAWQSLRQTEQQISSLIKKSEEGAARTLDIDWNKWEKAIAHKDIVHRLRAHYEQQAGILSALSEKSKGREGLRRVSALGRGWSLFDGALAACEASVIQSENLLNNGASALWISYHNPPLSKVDTNEWLDTDPYWQAFIEKHFFYAQYQPGVDDPESPAEREKTKACWHLRMAKFNDRSDTPMLYNFMESLPSWEYYDIHRRTFLEHMAYFLIRRGTDFRFFPEILPWQWLGDIEDQRYKFISVAQRRRAEAQLSSLAREKPLDLLPLDPEHDGADATLRFLLKEAETTTAAVARLMASFSFLCDPFIPCSSTRAALLAMEVDHGKGVWFELGDDVSALFYLPEAKARKVPRPTEAFHKLLDHLTLTGKRLNPSYATLFDSFADVLEQRGEHWFCADGECASQAFLRRLRDDDPSRDVFCDYFEEMYCRFGSGKEISVSEVLEKMKEKEKKHLTESEVYAVSAVATSPDTAAAAQEQATRLSHLLKSKQLQPIIDAEGLVILDREGNRVREAQELIASFQEFEKSALLFIFPVPGFSDEKVTETAVSLSEDSFETAKHKNYHLVAFYALSR